MPLQDLEADAPNLINPATGQPYTPGSPEYAAAIGPWITGQIGKESQRASNARGALYSGGALADEVQARTGALTALAQQGAAQSQQEKMLEDQMAFQAQQSDKQRQAEADAARAMGKAQMMGSAVQGGTGALGTLGGMAAYKSMFGGGASLADKMAGYKAAVAQGYPPADAAQMAGLSSAPPGAGVGGAGASVPASAADVVSTYTAPASEYSLSTAGTGVGQAPAASSGFGASMTAPGLPGVGGALMALPGAWYGSQAGQRTYGDSNAAKAGSGAGGLAGLIGGSMLGGPLGGAAGAAAGSFAGANYGTHPGDLLLGPAGLPLMIPGVRHSLQPIGDAFNGAGKAVGDFFGGLF